MPTLTPQTYTQTLIQLKNIIADGQAKALSTINKIRLETYWEMGELITKAIAELTSSDTADFYTKLAADLALDKTLLYRINQFFTTWPDGVPTSNDQYLSWSHHIELLTVKNEEERTFYLAEASEEGWSRAQLRKAVLKDYFHAEKEAEGTGNLKRDLNPMHYYKAIIENVIDGDTVLARVDLGFNVWVSQRFRFRGINAAEMGDGGEAAKQFVIDKLKDIRFVIIKTYKVDSYGRYVGDLFYHPTLKDKEDIAEDGFFLNQEVLKAGFAKLLAV